MPLSTNHLSSMTQYFRSMSMVAWTLFFHSLLTLTFAQSFTAPDSWQDPNVTFSVKQRIDIADNAITEALLSFDESTALFPVMNTVPTLPAYLFYEMAKFDSLTNDSKYKNKLLSYFSVVRNAHPNFQNFAFTNEPLTYGYAAMHAYHAYNDDSFLQFAKDSWSYGSNLTVSSDAMSAGKIDVKNFDLQSTCNGSTIVGGTFFQNDPNDSYLGGISTGAFFVLSAMLAEATSDQTYLNAATQSVDFILNHLTDGSNLVFDGLFANSCGNNGNPILSYNSGLGVEGLSVLASITSNSTLQTKMNNIISASTLSGPWLSSHGVLETSDDRPHYMMFGLTTVYNRTKDDSIRDFLGKFISVQYNAILTQSTVNGSNLYGKDWVGPPGVQVSPRSQTAALSVLVNAISLPEVPGSNTNTNTNDTGSNGSSSGGSHKNMGAIIGGAVGGAVVLLLICLGLWLMCRRNRNRHGVGKEGMSESVPTPFIGTAVRAHTNPNISRFSTSDPSEGSDNLSVMPPTSRMVKGSGTPRSLVVSNHAEGEAGREAMSTEELVRLLGQRLRDEQGQRGSSYADSEEVPPPAYRKT